MGASFIVATARIVCIEQEAIQIFITVEEMLSSISATDPFPIRSVRALLSISSASGVFLRMALMALQSSE
jgi:hypothetical protein